MRKLAFEMPARLTMLTAAAALGLLSVCVSAPLSTNEILAAYQEAGAYSSLTVLYPENETVFPPEIVPCTFSWREGGGKADTWLILLEFPDDRGRLAFLSPRTEWTPAPADWETIKQRSRTKSAKVTVLGVQRDAPSRIVSRGQPGSPPTGVCYHYSAQPPIAEAGFAPARLSRIEGCTQNHGRTESCGIKTASLLAVPQEAEPCDPSNMILSGHDSVGLLRDKDCSQLANNSDYC